MKSLVYLFIYSNLVLASAVVSATDIENYSFGVIRESSGLPNQALLLYISNQDCVAHYRVASHELIIAEGEIEVKKFKKTIPFGSSNIQIMCGTQNTLSVITK